MKRRVKKLFAVLVGGLLLLGFGSGETEERVVISIGSDALALVKSMFSEARERSMVSGDVALVEIPQSGIDALSAAMHAKFHRCGGFMVEESWEAGLAALNLHGDEKSYRATDSGLYEIKHEETVEGLIKAVAEPAVLATIEKLSSYRNRYYRASYGVASQEWVADEWRKLTVSRPEISVELFRHDGYPQPSVVLTWTGSQKPEEIVVLGGHGDSIAGWLPNSEVDAPGADDNASGIATITEVLRLLAASDFSPDRTLKFMAYAAEEVGLYGSKSIADQYAAAGTQVVGVMQLDMTNFAGPSHDIVLIEDHTNGPQNDFLRQLATSYLPEIRLGSDNCGYACSDHASWNRHGFPASFPFEATMDEHNREIHTRNDTLARSNARASHAVPFAKLALAFLVELSSL